MKSSNIPVSYMIESKERTKLLNPLRAQDLFISFFFLLFHWIKQGIYTLEQTKRFVKYPMQIISREPVSKQLLARFWTFYLILYSCYVMWWCILNRGQDIESQEMLRQGFTHAFLFTFHKKDDFTAFLSHPKHVEFSTTFSESIEKIVLLDFPAVLVKGPAWPGKPSRNSKGNPRDSPPDICP